MRAGTSKTGLPHTIKSMTILQEKYLLRSPTRDADSRPDNQIIFQKGCETGKIPHKEYIASQSYLIYFEEEEKP